MDKSILNGKTKDRNDNTYMIQWNKYFDKIYCIHYINAIERMPRLLNELSRVGILNSGIFEWFYGYDSPFFSLI